MNLKQNGLRRRVEIESRRIPSQHRQLDQFYGVLVDVLAHRDAAGSRTAFAHFADACRAHFAMEDEIYFPALHGLRPDLEHALTELVQEHRAMVRTLERLASLFEADRLAEAEGELDRLVTRLQAHEGREERILEGLRPARPAGGGPS